MYDYYIGGKNHFATDRETAENLLAVLPQARTSARENRAFLGRAVTYLTGQVGIRQYLDIGTGLPTANNVHEVAQGIAPSCRVVYADNDPLVLAHARALLRSAPGGRTGYIQADLRDPRAILDDPVTRSVLDFTEPIALMLVAILHFIPDEDHPERAVATLLDALPAGSYLVASHITGEHVPPQQSEAAQGTYTSSGVPFQPRDSGDFARMAFPGLDLVPPGVVLVSEWRPDRSVRPAAHEVNFYGGVARKP